MLPYSAFISLIRFSPFATVTMMILQTTSSGKRQGLSVDFQSNGLIWSRLSYWPCCSIIWHLWAALYGAIVWVFLEPLAVLYALVCPLTCDHHLRYKFGWQAAVFPFLGRGLLIASFHRGLWWKFLAWLRPDRLSFCNFYHQIAFPLFEGICLFYPKIGMKLFHSSKIKQFPTFRDKVLSTNNSFNKRRVTKGKQWCEIFVCHFLLVGIVYVKVRGLITWSLFIPAEKWWEYFLTSVW